MAEVGGEVFQDSTQMGNIATSIQGDADELKAEVEDMYKILGEELGEEDTGNRAWFGPKATVFKQNIDAKQVDFDNAVNNISKVSSNLQDQADAWNTFEQG